MSITSITFYIMLAVALILYYIIPLKFRWAVLFCVNIIFIFNVNSPEIAVVALLMALVCYLSALVIDKKRDSLMFSKSVMVLCVVLVVASLFLFKEQAFFVNTANKILTRLPKAMPLSFWEIAAPLGISYFSLTLISYVCEVYWGTISAEKNVFKFLTYSLFFPTLTSGPITKYKDTADNILGGHSFSYEGLCFGVQRILWGFFKKLVISERLSIAVNTIYDDYATYNGLYVPFAAMLFTVQLYTDFSGCIDIIMGVSEIFGIELPESFDKPFSAVSISEFWRKWNITLGTWLKEYILYPILKSQLFQNIGKKSKNIFGKKTGKKIPTWIALLISWFLIGFWHGGEYKYIFGVGLYMGVIIIASEMLEPVFAFIKDKLKIDDNTFSWKLFQQIRTFVLFSFGLSFFRAATLKQGFDLWKNCFAVWNPWVLFDKSLFELGLSADDVIILQLSVLVLLITGIISLITNQSVRKLIASQNLVFRWLIWMALFIVVLIYGMYGPGYDAGDFIYKGF